MAQARRGGPTTEQRRGRRWLPLLVGVVFSVLSVWLWQALKSTERSHLERETRLAADDVIEALRERTQLRFGRLARMARRWESWGPFPQAQWEMDAALSFEPTSYQAIEWIDTDGKVQWVVPGQGNSVEMGRHLAREPMQKEALERAAARREMTIGGIFKTAQEAPGFRLYVPTFRNGKVDGYVAGVFSLPEILETVLEGVAGNYQVAVSSGARTVYLRGTAGDTNQEWAKRGELDLQGLPLQVEVWPSERMLAQVQSPLPLVTLGAGLLLSWLLALAAWLTQQAQGRAQALAQEAAVRAEAEQALRESQRLLTEAQRLARLGSWEWDIRRNALRWSEETHELLGYTAEELGTTMEGCLMVVHADDRERVRAALEEARAKRKIFETEHRIVRSDGVVRFVYAQAQLELEASGQPVRMVGVVQDVTERQQAEEAVRASEAKFRALAESAASAIFMTRDDIFLYVNRATEHITGYTQPELIGRSFWELVHADDVEMVRERREARLRGEPVPARYEFRVRTKSGETRWLDFTATMADYEGAPAVLGTAFDVTDRRRAEEQLVQAQKMEAVGRLAGGIAHDFNNLLMLIKGYSELLGEYGSGDETVRRHASEIEQAADRATSLTRQLLAFSRRQVLEPRVINMNEVVSGVEKMLGRLIGEDIELVTRLGRGLRSVRVDPGQIEQVILNLAVNARDAMPRGGRLTLETANVELDENYAREHAGVEPGGYVVLAVGDTGSGMTREVRAHAFEPFFTTKEKGKGTGLGLATVYGIVRQSGGHVWLYSEPGLGATFKIYFPQVEAPAEALAAPRAEGELPRGTETVLLAEDAERVRALARQFLESLGYTVLEAASAEDAVRLAAMHDDSISVLMTDVVMPLMSGRELASRLVATHPGMKVLFMSGYTDDMIVGAEGLEPGTAFLQKPFTREVLAVKLRELLG